MISDMIVEDSR